MPRLKRLTGSEVITILSQFEFRIDSQRRSPVKLRRTSPGQGVQVLTVPRHSDLDIETIGAISQQAFRFILEDELRKTVSQTNWK